MKDLGLTLTDRWVLIAGFFTMCDIVTGKFGGNTPEGFRFMITQDPRLKA